MAESLITKYRPQSLQDYFGNKQLKVTVKKMLSNNTLPHAILLSGNSGSGKTTLARIIAKELNCTGIDLTEFNIADTNGVDSIRDLIENANYRPMVSESRVYILDECHQMTTQAQNALLKVLEEPKPWVYFILCTTDPQKLLNTIKSRTTQFSVKPLEGEDYFSFVDEIYCKEKGIEIEQSPLSEKFLFNLYNATGGEPRAILSNLEKIIHIKEDKLDSYKFIANEEEQKGNDLARVLYKSNNWVDIAKELSKITSADVESTRRAVLGYATAIVSKGNYDEKAHRIITSFIQPFFDKGLEKTSITKACLDIYKGVSR